MKNVKLTKAIKGWFLTVESDIDGIENTWAITSLELWTIGKLIRDNEKLIQKEINEVEP